MRRMPSLGREREASVGSRRHARGVSFDLKESPLEAAEAGVVGEGATATTTSATSGRIEEEPAAQDKP